MRMPKILSGLQKSTIITILSCACLLALTALILVFLMLFPITPEQNISLQNTQPVQTEESTDAVLPSEEWQNTEAPHTLSTWSVSVDGHSHSPDEYWDYMRSTTDESQESSETAFSETTSLEFTEPTEIWQESTTEHHEETGYSGMESSEYIHSDSQTQTETVNPPDVTDPPPTEEQPPVVIDPPPFEPEQPEEQQ